MREERGKKREGRMIKRNEKEGNGWIERRKKNGMKVGKEE